MEHGSPWLVVHFPGRIVQKWTVLELTWPDIAKNIVAAGLSSKCQVSLAYAMGVAQPVMVQVDTFGTGKVCADDCLELAIPLVFGLTPKQIVDTLRLTRPIFRQTAAFGHFGRKEFPWERTDKAEALRNAVI